MRKFSTDAKKMLTFSLRALIFLCTAVWVCFGHPNFPSYIKQCYRNADADRCVIENVEAAREHIANGIPELHMPPMDPFRIKQIAVPLGSLQIMLNDVKIHDGSRFKINKWKMDFDELSVALNVDFPFLVGGTEYSVVGDLFMMHLNTSGSAVGNITGVELISYSKMKPKEVKGKTYLIYDHADIKLNVYGRVHMYFANIFPGRDDLTKSMNDLINDNVEQLTEDYRAPLQAILSAYVKELFSKLFKNYPLEDLFPLES